MTAPTTGRRDRKKSQTRQGLRDAALRLALAHGYDNLTVEAITEATDVSTRTFFNYFSSKDDALLGPDPDRAAEFAQALDTRPADEPPVAALRATLTELAGSFTGSEALWQARMALVRANPQLWPAMVAGFTAFERTLTEAVAARTGCDPQTDLYPGVVAAATMGAVRMAVAHWRAGSGNAPLPDLLTEAFDILAAGLAPRLPLPAHGASR